MHSFVGPNGWCFNFNSDLSGPVLVHHPDRTLQPPVTSSLVPRMAIDGDDVAAFCRRIQSEYPGALTTPYRGDEPPYLDVKPIAVSHALGEMHLRLAELTARVALLESVHESKRAEHHCPKPGCLLDAGHSTPCRVLGGAPFSAEPEL